MWVANDLDSTVTRIDPATNSVRATIPVGDGPNGIAVAGGVVWVSNEITGTLTKIDPVRNVPAGTVPTGNQPEGIVVDAGALFVAVRASGVGHRGGTLTVLSAAAESAPSTLPSAYNTQQEQLDHARGRRAHRASARWAAAEAPRSCPISPSPSPSRPTVDVPTPSSSARRALFERGARPAAGLPPRARARRPRQPLGFADVLRGISGLELPEAPKAPCDLSKGIVADDGRDTVTFHLTAPDPNFLYLLAQSEGSRYPPEPRSVSDNFVPGTGPYRVGSFNPKRGVRSSATAGSASGLAAAQPSGFPDTIVERFGSKADKRVAAVLHGSADLAADVAPSPSVIESLRTQHLSQLKQNPWTSTWFIVLNTRVPPFDNLDARRALNFAIDRQHLRDLALGQGLGHVTCQILPPDFEGYSPYCPYTVAPNATGAWTGPDLARAQQLVRRSGTKGEKVTFWFPNWLSQFSPASGRYVVSVLDSLGYKAQVRSPKNDRMPTR